jgi:uncharacterized membrane protein YfcA
MAAVDVLPGDWVLLWLPTGVLIGAWAGLSGYSAWPVVVPLLFAVLGRPLHESLVASLFIDWVNAVCASAVYLWRGDADRGTACRWAVLAAPGVLVGAGLSFTLLTPFEAWLGAGSGPVALVLGVALLARAARMGPGGEAPPLEQEMLSTRARRTLLGAGMELNGLGIGLIGMGGGFNAAILLIVLRGDGMRAGVATGLLFSSLVLPVALVTYLLLLRLDVGVWSLAVAFAGIAGPGAALSAWLGSRIRGRDLGYAVGGCVLLAGLLATAQRWATW